MMVHVDIEFSIDDDVNTKLTRLLTEVMPLLQELSSLGVTLDIFYSNEKGIDKIGQPNE
jgi:hypothetical protein